MSSNVGSDDSGILTFDAPDRSEIICEDSECPFVMTDEYSDFRTHVLDDHVHTCGTTPDLFQGVCPSCQELAARS
jgi:hypothetical protein